MLLLVLVLAITVLIVVVMPVTVISVVRHSHLQRALDSERQDRVAGNSDRAASHLLP